MKPYKNSIINILIVLSVFLFYIWAREFQSQHRVSEQKLFPEVSIEALAADSDPIRLEMFRGQFVVVNFAASWCEACKNERPILRQLYSELSPKGVRFIGVASFDKKEDVISSELFPFPASMVGFDGDGRLAKLLEVRALPQTFVISPEGRILRRFLGELKKREINSLRELVADETFALAR